MATVRAGVLPTLGARPRRRRRADRDVRHLAPRGRVRVLARTRDDDLDLLAEAHTVIGVGQGVAARRVRRSRTAARRCSTRELGATRKVTDKGWLPRSRQIGITGRSIAPRLFVSIGASGKFNHTVGLRAAGTVLAINPDPDAPIFDVADAGIVGDWRAGRPAARRAAARAARVALRRRRASGAGGRQNVTSVAVAPPTPTTNTITSDHQFVRREVDRVVERPFARADDTRPRTARRRGS